MILTGRSLEVGSGYHPTPGFTHRCDLNPHAPGSDACCPADKLPWPDGYFDELRAVDVLEHISYRDTLTTLQEWRRVLGTGGRLYVQVPDVETAISMYLDKPRAWDERNGLGTEPAIVGLAWVLLGGHVDGVNARDGDPWHFNAHAALFDKPSLAYYLLHAGFDIESMETNPHPNLCVWAVAV